MISRIVSSLRLLSLSHQPDTTPANPCVDPLEKRLLFAAAATSIFTDNRGEVQITFNQPLDPATVNTRGVFVHTAGADDAFGTADDLKIVGRVKTRLGGRRILFVPDEKVPFIAGSSYSIKVNSKRVFAADGSAIDGEFNGGGINTGDGTPGGDLLVLSKRNKTNLTARFTTLAGNMDVRMLLAEAPKNVANFVTYANEGMWDNTFVQRSLPGFIWQSGGYTVTPQHEIDDVTPLAPADNEPAVTQAKRGTLSLARPDDGNPATDDKGTNQWFFNLVDNEANLGSQNGGFTEFGEVIGDYGLSVMDKLAAYPTINAGGVFSNLAVQQPGTTPQQAGDDPQGTLVTIRRIAFRNVVVAWPI